MSEDEIVKNGLIIDDEGNKSWYKNGVLHRDDDLPAVELIDDIKLWYKNGFLHRDNDLPAMIYSNGDMSWWINGKMHRDNDLPAVVFSQGNHKEWFQHGKKHRYTGHAVEYFNRKEFWINNEELTEVEFIYFLENKDSKEQLKKDLETNLPIHTKKGIHKI